MPTRCEFLQIGPKMNNEATVLHAVCVFVFSSFACFVFVLNSNSNNATICVNRR